MAEAVGAAGTAQRYGAHRGSNGTAISRRRMMAAAPPVTIFDPANGKQPFPGNVIPKSRFNPDGAKILNWYPAPNALGRPLLQLSDLQFQYLPAA